LYIPPSLSPSPPDDILTPPPDENADPPKTITNDRLELLISAVPKIHLRAAKEMISTSSFSEEFLQYFQHRTLRGNKFLWVSAGRKLSAPECKIMCDELSKGRVSFGVMSQYLGIHKQTLKRIASNVKNNRPAWRGKGRPPAIDSGGTRALRSATQKREEEKNAFTVSEMSLTIRRLAMETDLRRGGNGLSIEPITPKTRLKYIALIGARELKGQNTTSARARESLDIRNFISMAAMNAAFSSGRSPHLLGNMDSTTFVVSFTDKGRLISMNKESPATRVQSATTDIRVKQLFLVSASGKMAEPLFILSCDDLKDVPMIHLRLSGLSPSMISSKSMGHIIVCNSRRGDEGMWRWVWENYVPPFVSDMRELCAQPRSPFYLVTDGEAVQIAPLDDSKVLEKLNSLSIDIGKGPASCSGICGNALDCSNVFKGIKTRLRNTNAPDITEPADDEMELIVSNALRDAIKQSKPLWRKKAARAMMHVIYNEANSLKPSTIQDGFRRIGMIPLEGSNEPLWKTTLRCCPNFKDISSETIKRLEENWDSLVEKMGDSGQLTEADLDAANIPRPSQVTKSNMEKDEKVQHQQRAILLTAQSSVSRRREWRAKKDSKTSSTIREPRKRGRPPLKSKGIQSKNKKLRMDNQHLSASKSATAAVNAAKNALISPKMDDDIFSFPF
jgi:hypothetical protein